MAQLSPSLYVLFLRQPHATNGGHIVSVKGMDNQEVCRSNIYISKLGLDFVHLATYLEGVVRHYRILEFWAAMRPLFELLSRTMQLGYNRVGTNK